MKIFWAILTFACVAWYLVVTVYVALRGFGDIKSMLQNLKDRDDSENAKDLSS